MKINNLFSHPLGSVPSYNTVKKEMPVPLAIPIAMAATSLASSVFGGISSSKANKRAMEEARTQKAKEDALIARRRYENYLDTSAGQALMTRAREFNRENWKRAAGEQAVTGGTDAKAAMAKEAGNKMMADTISNIAIQDAARKDGVDAEQLASDRAYSQQVQAYEQQRGQIMSQVAQGVSDALAQGAVALASSGGNNLSGGNNGGTPTGTAAPALTTNQSPLYNSTAFWGKNYGLTRPQFRPALFR